MVLVLIGLFFLTLTLLTFALSGLNPKVTNTARVNLCISLLLSHLLVLLVQEFIHLIRPHKVLNTVLFIRVFNGWCGIFFMVRWIWINCSQSTGYGLQYKNRLGHLRQIRTCLQLGNLR